MNDRGIVVGNAITGEPKYFIPDPGDLTKMIDTGSSASGIQLKTPRAISMLPRRRREQFEEIHQVEINYGELKQAARPALACLSLVNGALA